MQRPSRAAIDQLVRQTAGFVANLAVDRRPGVELVVTSGDPFQARVGELERREFVVAYGSPGLNECEIAGPGHLPNPGRYPSSGGSCSSRSSSSAYSAKRSASASACAWPKAAQA
jgi:hypothetical protein